MKTLLACLIVAASAWNYASAADDDKLEGDLKALQGKWAATVGPQKDIPIVLEVKGKNITLTVTTPQMGDIKLKAELKLDEKAKPFPTMDWTKFIGPDGQEMPDNKAIYEIKGEELKICGSGPDAERPKEFKEGEGPGGTLTLKKVKEDDKKDKDKDKSKEEKKDDK